ncbi:hypothetical protein POM88_010418 [Heracleum sosnowskyi]|uniref:Uncharacterized protein n=1 Tax=Heracleum sosnowskyi TaxID=360622 RepID=A0AAD8IVZ3_9APIA|nr:hypothetical protein POM88_010418 [Heracleum sosnowskyi]
MKKLKTLQLSCNVRLCLPMILCFSSLERLTLTDEEQILSSAKPFSLSKLFNLRSLELVNFTNLGSSIPELPFNLEELCVVSHNSLETLPDLSSLKKLKKLNIWGCINLQSISLLPSHLRSLRVEECTSLQDVPDLSMLKELEDLRFTQCYNLKSTSLKQSSLQVSCCWSHNDAQSHFYKSIHILFTKQGGLALWVVYTCKAVYKDSVKIRAVITNNTRSITDYPIYVECEVGETQSRVECIPGKKLSMRSGDRIKVSFPGFLYYRYDKFKVPIGEVKVKMCGVHLIPSTSV